MACRCYKIINGVAAPCTTVYKDCNNTLQTHETVGESTAFICVNSIESSTCDSYSDYAPCYKGQCVTGSTGQLLYGLLTTLGPCPDVCDGTAPGIGGSTGTSLIDIRTGLRLNSNGESILPTPPTPESSGTIVFNGLDPTDPLSSYVAAPKPTLGTWLPGTGDFTVEWFQKMDLTNSGGAARVFSIGPDTTATLGISIEGGGSQFYVWSGGGIKTSGSLPTLDGVWVHFAISYNSAIDGGNMSVFIGGDNLANSTMLGLDITDVTNNLFIGSDGYHAGDGFAGNITNFRWTNSVVYPVGDPTITVPSAPLTILPDTKLLLLGGSISNPVSDSTGINTLDYNNITWSSDTPF